MQKQLNEIWIYPVKSLAGIRVKQATVLEKGLEHDRRFMLVDSANRFITQREHPELALFTTTIVNDQIHITHSKTKKIITLHLQPQPTSEFAATIWNDTVTVTEVDTAVSKWFSEHLKFACGLVYFPEKNSRPVDGAYALNNEQVSLADGYPFLIIGQASLDDLNSRLPEPVEMRRFRPNFVFTGGEPYEEDTWGKFSIGAVHFAGVKNCSRCVLTNVNPATGVKGDEPLRTLSQYRKKNGKVYFGQNLVVQTPGTISEGDIINLSEGTTW